MTIATMQPTMTQEEPYPVLWFDEVGRADLARVGGKNASLGEMVQTLANQGIRVPNGFATTKKKADAYWHYLEANDLKSKISQILADQAAAEAHTFPQPVNPSVPIISAANGPRGTSAAID